MVLIFQPHFISECGRAIMNHCFILIFAVFMAKCHSYRPSRNVFFPCSFKGQLDYLCHCGGSMSRCSKTGYQDTEQYTGCIRSDHVRYCCEDDISKHQWVYSLSSFISDDDGSDISVNTCVKQDERWMGGKTRMSHIGEVACADPTYVHCRVKTQNVLTGLEEFMNFCQSVLHKCNGKCFKGRSWCQASSSCVLTEAYNFLCPPTPIIMEPNQRSPVHLETSTETEHSSGKFINVFLMPSAVICCILLLLRFGINYVDFRELRQYCFAAKMKTFFLKHEEEEFVRRSPESYF